MKKRISIYTEHYKYAVFMVILVFLINTYNVYQDEEAHLYLKLFFPIVGILISAGVHYYFKLFIKRNPPIQFNNSTIYTNKTTIPFKDVISVKTLNTNINNRHKLKITYLDNNKSKNNFSFYPRILHINLREFIKLINKHNPKAEVQKQFIGPFKFDDFRTKKSPSEQQTKEDF